MMRHYMAWLLQFIAVVVIAALTIRHGLESGEPRLCEAVIHVTELGVDVEVDGRTYRVETPWDTPIVCGLPPGRHGLRMSRSGQVLYEEDFRLERGDMVVLTAWDARRSDSVSASRSYVGRTYEDESPRVSHH